MKFLHEKHFIHRDIKPENFCAGKQPNDSSIYIIDLGLSKRYRDEQTRIHVPYKEGKTLTGTLRYGSKNSHEGIESTRRDDLESVGYMLIYFLKGVLPWQGLNNVDKEYKHIRIKELKNEIPLSKLCEGLPNEFEQYLKHCYGLQFDEEPNYKFLIELFTNLFNSKDYEMDGNYDWVTAVIII